MIGSAEHMDDSNSDDFIMVGDKYVIDVSNVSKRTAVTPIKSKPIIKPHAGACVTMAQVDIENGQRVDTKSIERIVVDDEDWDTVENWGVIENINNNMVTDDISFSFRREYPTLIIDPNMLATDDQIINVEMKLTSDDDDIRTVAGQVDALIGGFDKNGRVVKGARALARISLGKERPRRPIEITKKLINATYYKLVDLVDGKKPNGANIITFVTCAIKLVEQITNMKKGRRVELILAVLREYIEHRDDLTGSEKDDTHELVEAALPVVYRTLSNGWAHEKIIKILLKCKCECYK